MFASYTVVAQKNNEQQLEKDANALFKAGEYLKAYPLYSQLLALYPAHADYNYKFGACAIYSEPDKTKAVKFLSIATSKAIDDPMVWYYLGKAYHLNYQFKDAIKSYETFMRKADPKISSKTDAQRCIETCIYGSNLLTNIKDVDVISKTDADKNNFFRYFNLEEVGGKILTIPDALKTKLDQKSSEPGVMHHTGNGTTIFFSSYGKDGSMGKDIYRAQVLPDGKFSTPEKLKGDVNTKYDEDFCFMHSDGKTLFFSSKGHNSMGGYDIFKSVYDPATDSFGHPVNLDFAINTPDDDIFYICDSLNQRAYFASGRSSDLNHLSVYNVMVESTPLQVVYIKGDFFSEINNEQKKAAFKIVEPNSNRIVCDASTYSNGSYVLYVPRSNEYTFKVVTENSPVEHDVNVKIPVFDRPVALRQEIRLISENGKDKIVVKNYFDEPLEEDLSSLAADMLRKKAGLEVNTSLPSVNSKEPVSANAHALEPTMENAPLAAGFKDGVTVKGIISDMEIELAEVRQFVAESDQKYNNSFAYSMKKQKEAEASLATAEAIRKTMGGYSSEEDIAKLKDVYTYTSQAEVLQREAIASMNAAEAVKNYKAQEADRVQKMDDKIRELRQAEASQNFDATVIALKKEKERQNATVNENGSTPFADLMAEAKTKEETLHEAERTLTEMRAKEKNLEAKTASLKEKISSSTKKNERQAAENEFLTQKAELDKLRKDIVTQNTKIKSLGDQTKLAYANIEVFKRLASDTGMGLTATEKRSLTDTEKTALTMKLAQMKERITALEITDPQMLAMVTDPTMGTTTNVGTSNVSRGGSITVTSNNYNQGSTNASNSTSTSGINHGQNQQTTKSIDAATLKNDKDLALKKTGSSPAMIATRRMFIAGSLEQTQMQIAALETKKQQGTFNTADNESLIQLTKLRGELQQDLSANEMASAVLSTAEFNATVAAIIPNYVSDINVITAASPNEIERVKDKVDYKNAAIIQLKEARINNAMAAMAETEANKVAQHTQTDKQLDAAIAQLEKENNGIAQFTVAYDKDKKAIIESNESEDLKNEKQSELTMSYMAVLDMMEEDKQKQLDVITDLNESEKIRLEIGEVKQEKAKVATQLAEYRKTSNTAASTTKTAGVSATGPKPALKSLEDELEIEDQKLTSNRTNVAQGVPKKSEAEVAKDAMQIEKMFKPRNQAESIFAYESGIFQEIVAKHQSPENTLKNRDKIADLNNQIFLIEGEMENVTSESKLRKLDYQAEQIYLKRALIEIDNSPAIARMAAVEYETQYAKANELTQVNREKIDSRYMIKEEIAKLQREAIANMEEAIDMRKLSPSFSDDIERADNDRQAFAKEALAIEQLRQIQDINNNIDLLLSYTDQNLAMLRTGKVPQEHITDKPVALTAELSVDSTEAEMTETSATTENKMPKPDALNLVGVNGSIADTSDDSTISVNTKSKQNENGTASVAPVEQSVQIAENNNAAVNGQGDRNAATQKVDTPGMQLADNANSQTSAMTSGNGGMTATHGTNSKVPDSVIESKSTENVKADQPIAVTVSNKENAGVNKPKPSQTSAIEPFANQATPVSLVDATVKSQPTMKSAVSSEAAVGGVASNYYFNAPKELTTDIFSRTNRAVYSNSQPIPIDMEMPKGVYYKVQIGAFRNDIPQNLYDEFAPVSGEKLDNGITRYTAGYFQTFENADNIKREIRGIGYSDAFVVAFRDGKRIPLYEAMGKTEGESVMASIEKEYVYGDKGEAPKANIKVTPKAAPSAVQANGKTNSGKPKTTKGADNKNNGSIIYTANYTSGGAPVSDYYAGFPEAAKATKVEVTQGLFFTVQVGVYSRPVAAKSLHYINPVNSELTESKKIRYTSGMYTSMQEAVDKRSEARALGIADAFVTAYYNGQRISLSEADKLLKEKGNGILIQKGIN